MGDLHPLVGLGGKLVIMQGVMAVNGALPHLDLLLALLLVFLPSLCFFFMHLRQMK
jgi:hypothetical protein